MVAKGFGAREEHAGSENRKAEPQKLLTCFYVNQVSPMLEGQGLPGRKLRKLVGPTRPG